MPRTCSLNSPEVASIVNSISGTVSAPLVADPQLDQGAFGNTVHAAAETPAHALDHALGIRDPKPWEKLAGEQRALVVLADDGEVPVCCPGKAEVIAGRAN